MSTETAPVALVDALSNGPPPIELDLAPDLPIPEAAPDFVVEALQQIRQGDTIDVVARRLRGTSALASRAGTMAAIPMTAMTLLAHSEGFGPQTLVIGGTTSVLAGAAAPALVYTAQRLTEKKRLRGAEASAQVVRDYLQEPVDIIRDKNIGIRRGKTLTLRWCGADAAYGGDERDLLERFEGIVAFAEGNDIGEVVASARLLDLGKKADQLRGDYADKLTTTEALFKAKKGIPIRDKTADDELLRLTPAEARALLQELGGEGLITKTEVIANWLLRLRPNHPLAAPYKKWLELGRPDELRGNLAEIMRGSLDRHFNNTVDTSPIRVNHQRIRVDATIAIGPHGVQTITTPRMRDAMGQSQGDVISKPWGSIVGGDLDTEFVPSLLTREAALTRVRSGQLEDGEKCQAEEMTPSEQWKLEVALYHLLRKQGGEDLPRPSYRGLIDSSGDQQQTLYARIVGERPRTFPRTWLPERGAVAKNDQTISYDRLFLRNAAKKLGATALALALGMGAGAAWGEAWNYSSYADAVTCSPRVQNESGDLSEPPKPLTDAEIASCNSLIMRLSRELGARADGVSSANSILESEALIKAYEMGILTPENAEDLLRFVSNDWANQKIADLEQRYNLYGGSDGLLTDAHLGSQGDATIWQLDPINGASTKGYWTSNIQSNIILEPRNPGISAPPFDGLDVVFSPQLGQEVIVPIGTIVSPDDDWRTLRYRELQVPATVDAQGRQLITVRGRQLLASFSGSYPSTDIVTAGPNPDYESGNLKRWQSFTLPMLEGGDIVAIKVSFNSLSTDAVSRDQPATRIVQYTDGSFHLLVPYGQAVDDTKQYLTIQYTIDPNATTGLPFHAERRMTAQTTGDYGALLTDIITSKDVAGLLQALNLRPDASIGEIKEAIAKSRTYSFTPYADNHAKATISFRDSNMTTAQALLALAEYAEKLDSANCTLATLIEVIASRGEDSDEFINFANGFNNGNGDNALAQSESHEWGINNKGINEDAVPRKGNADRQTLSFKDSPKSSSEADRLKEIAEAAGAAAALLLGMYAGYRLTGPALQFARRRRRQAAEDWFAGENPQLDADLDLLGRLLHTHPDTIVDERPITDRTGGVSRTAEQRLARVPDITRSDIPRIVAGRKGHVSPATQARLRAMTDKARRAQDRR